MEIYRRRYFVTQTSMFEKQFCCVLLPLYWIGTDAILHDKGSKQSIPFKIDKFSSVNGEIISIYATSYETFGALGYASSPNL